MSSNQAFAPDATPGPATRVRLRIGLVTETYPPEINGVANTVAQIVDGLRARRHAVMLVRPRQASDAPPRPAGRPAAAWPSEVLLRGLPIPCYPELRLGLPAAGRLHRLWSAQRPDLVHIATEGPLGWSALRAARQLGVPVTSDFRTNFHAYSQHYGGGWLQRPIAAALRSFHNRTLCTMVPTPTLQQELSALGFERTAVVARGVDADRFCPAHRDEALRRRWGLAADGVAVMYVGRLAPEKNLGLLLEAYDAMRQADTRVRLVVVGDGPQRAALQARCPDAVFAGAQRGDALAAHYASGDLFAFPSLTETFGNVIVEAMASGLPVVAFDAAAARVLVRDGENGALAAPHDPAAFVRACVRIASDGAVLGRLGAAARLGALDMDWERIVAQVEGLFMSATLARRMPAAAAPLATKWGLPG